MVTHFFSCVIITGSNIYFVLLVPAIIIDNEDVGQSSLPIIASDLRSHNDGSVISLTNSVK